MGLLQLVLVATLGFLVFTVDTAVSQETLQVRLLRAAIGPITLLSWFSRRDTSSLSRLAGNVWLLVTFGWLVTMEYDHLHRNWWWPLLVWATGAFLAHCVDGMSVKLYKKPLKRISRAVYWPKAFCEYITDPDSVRLLLASLMVWVFLTTGWFLALLADRVS